MAPHVCWSARSLSPKLERCKGWWVVSFVHRTITLCYFDLLCILRGMIQIQKHIWCGSVDQAQWQVMNSCASARAWMMAIEYVGWIVDGWTVCRNNILLAADSSRASSMIQDNTRLTSMLFEGQNSKPDLPTTCCGSLISHICCVKRLPFPKFLQLVSTRPLTRFFVFFCWTCHIVSICR